MREYAFDFDEHWSKVHQAYVETRHYAKVAHITVETFCSNYQCEVRVLLGPNYWGVENERGRVGWGRVG